MSSLAVLTGCGASSSGNASPAKPDPSSVPSQSAPAATSSPTPAGKPLAGKTISIDPGHNGLNGANPGLMASPVPAGPFQKPCNTSGTSTASGYQEHAFTFDVATRLVAILRSKGANVVETRTNDHGTGPCVNERAAIANNAHADAAISIHGDGAPSSGYGFHVILPALIKGYTEPIVVPSKKLGYDIRDAFHAGTGEPYSSYLGNNGIDVRSDLAGLNLSKVPAVFIECGNMANSGDASRMTDPAWRQRAAASLANGLTTFLR